MAPPSNGSASYGGAPGYGQPQQPYQHHHSPYQNQPPHHQQQQPQQTQQQPPQHQQPYQQPPPPSAHQHQQQQNAHSSPTSTSPIQQQQQPAAGEAATSRLEAVSTVVGPRRYALEVEQQPIRARMCGFGDKDRRPLTPPPALRLVVTDVQTGREVDVNSIDFAQYVVTVDLWDETGTREVNLVRSTTATPAISSTIHESFNNLETMPYRAANIAPYPAAHPGQMTLYSQHQSPVNPYAPNQYGQVQSYPQPPASNSFGQPPYGYSNDFAPMYRPPQVFEPGMGGAQRLSIGGAPGSSIQGMFTRNLIGNCAGSAFRLHDTKERIGIWFVMQDLSVRTEGSFRLRFSFVDVKPTADQKGDAPVKTGRAPILASVFSDVFQVYSAKKFPGVCDSTDLSKCFATQGIKIPIRKEGGKAGGGDDDDDEE
ncbi:VelB [Diaporthe eres]|nr:VelB [Diaporthe eres]